MAINENLFLIGTFAIFMQGYYFRRKHLLGVVISAILSIFQLLTGIFINGIGPYEHSILSNSITDLSFALAYTLFWWFMGYVVGGNIPDRKYWVVNEN